MQAYVCVSLRMYSMYMSVVCALGFKMYAVGVGNAVEDELREIASEPIGDHYFYTADFKAMTQIAKKLQINVCQGENICLSVCLAHIQTHTYT